MPLPVELPISKHFPPDRQKEISEYCWKRLQSLRSSLKGIREDKITSWRRIYYGVPREASKSFPWQNASNLVVQLVGSFVDQLKAKILMSVFGVDPLFTVELVGEWPREEKGEEQRSALESWLTYSGVEPSYLNLLPKYSAWVSTMIRYGMGAIKILPERRVEQVAASLSDTGRVVFEERTRHDGPVAHPLQFEDFLIPLTVAELERSPFTAQRVRMSRFDLELLQHDPSYDKAAVEVVLKSPDRNGPDRTTREVEQDQGTQSNSGTEVDAEWDIFECYFPYTVAGRTFHLILTYHFETKQTLKAVFNWLPENSLPFIKAVLGYDGERSYGFGFCEMLKDYQEEVSAIHNRRGDASTLSNTNIFRIQGGTQLDSQFSVYPNAIFPGEDGAFEAIPLGRTANETIKDETITLQLATDRAGVGPSSSGSGAGTVNKKGAYSAMGTYSVMQEGDTRANLNKTEFRQAHYLLGRQKILYDANFGIPDRDLKAFGQQAAALKSAFENTRKNRLRLPIRAATGSINKEVEKQNLMLLLNNYRAHWQMGIQLLSQMDSPMVPPVVKDYMWQTFLAGNLLMGKISKDFGILDPTAILPAPSGAEVLSALAGAEAKMQAAAEVQQKAPMLQGAAGGQPGQPGSGPQQPAPEQSPAQPAPSEPIQ